MKILAGLASILFLMSLSACNTMQGVGQDIEDAGEAIEDRARRADDD